MATLSVFKSRILSCKYIFRNGKEANFINGKFLTDVEDEIAELTKEVKEHNPTIYIDEAEKVIESEMLDPLVALKAKLRVELLAEMEKERQRSDDPNSDKGTTGLAAALTAKLQGITSSRNVAEAASGSTSAA